MRTQRRGFALLLSMLLILALSLLSLGLLAVGTREQVVGLASVRRAQAQQWAEAAALQAIRAWSTRSVEDMRIGEQRLVRGVGPGGTATVERVDTALFLVRGRGAVPEAGGAATASVGLLVRVLSPRRLARAVPGALNADGPVDVAGGRIEGLDACGDPAPGIVAPTVTIAPGADVGGEPPILSGPPPEQLPPHRLDPALAAAVGATEYPGATVTPAPTAAVGRCVPGAENWGSPDPAHPCHELRPVLLTADLTVDGGESHGILIVDGDLHVTGGAHLTGVVVVTGRLQLDSGSTIQGAVRVDSAVTAGAIIRDGCAIADVLRARPLDRAFRPPVRWWLPLF